MRLGRSYPTATGYLYPADVLAGPELPRLGSGNAVDSVIRRKFGDAIRSRSRRWQRREVVARGPVHDIHRQLVSPFPFEVCNRALAPLHGSLVPLSSSCDGCRVNFTTAQRVFCFSPTKWRGARANHRSTSTGLQTGHRLPLLHARQTFDPRQFCQAISIVLDPRQHLRLEQSHPLSGYACCPF